MWGWGVGEHVLEFNLTKLKSYSFLSEDDGLVFRLTVHTYL